MVFDFSFILVVATLVTGLIWAADAWVLKPQRVVAWHGLAMLRELNANYLDPLKPVYPANRLGPLGDSPKANCATCHQGASKPLLGQSMAKDFPELGGKPAP